MFRRVSTMFYSVPTPVGGLALGLASLGLGLENAFPLHNMGQSIGAFVSMVLVSLLFMKFLLHPALFREEIQHPVLGSIIPTLAMALMIQSKTLAILHPFAAELLWLFAVLVHVLLLGFFLFFRVRTFRLDHMVPSWFVPFVGISIAAITVPDVSYSSVAYLSMLFGIINYAIMLPVMFYRLILSQEIADPFKPTIAILAAPASLSLLAYLSAEKDPSLLVCGILLGVALLMTSIVYLAFFKLLRLPFSPAFAAYTFPMAVGAAALYKVADCLAVYPAFIEYSHQMRTLATVELGIATCVVLYVCARFLLYSIRAWSAVTHAKKISGFVKCERLFTKMRTHSC